MLFVLRDFFAEDNEEEKKQDLSGKIRADIKKIWDEIHKPEKFANNVAEDFFDLEFEFMPNKMFCPKDFKESVGNLRTRFDVGSNNSLFLEKSSDNVPLDGLAFYMEQNWASIRSNKELNLPDQRKLVAEFRCNEQKDAAVAEVSA
jgi:hypothetical protein